MFHMRVDLRCPDAGMSQNFLQCTNVCTASQHVCCEAVTQRVWTDIATSDSDCISPDQGPDGFPAETFPTAREKNPAFILTADGDKVSAFFAEPRFQSSDGDGIQ